MQDALDHKLQIGSSSKEIGRLLSKYGGSVPRYTSYPTAVQLQSCADEVEPTQKLSSAAQAGQTVALYVHVPFCKSLCYFCACNKIITESQEPKKRYLRAIRAEAEMLRSRAVPLVAQIHLGGGSPSYLSHDDMATLLDIVDESFPIADNAERSIELDPRTTSESQIKFLAQRGFSRASLGVQDLDPKVQRLVNRVQPFSLVRDTTEVLRHCGFAVNFDLIFGLPGQTQSSFARTIEAALSLAPDRVALYAYAHVQWKVKVQRTLEKYDLPSPRARFALFSRARKQFERAGYMYVGMDHFAAPNDKLARAARDETVHRNFMGYTVLNASGVLGLGPSSISDVGGMLWQNEIDLTPYEKRILAGRLPIAKKYDRTPEDEIRRARIESIMCNGVAPLKSAEGIERAIITSAITRLSDLAMDGLVTISRDEVRVTESGRYFLRNVAACFDSEMESSLAPRRYSTGA